MDKKIIIILKAEIEAQIRIIENIYSKIEERELLKEKSALESIGYQLHNLYCSFEDLFKMIASTFENHVENTARYHSELLKKMTIDIDGIRPKLLSQESYYLLENLKSFRHFFRHAYSYELDERKLKIVLEDAKKLREIYKKDINNFLEKIL